MAGEKNLRSFRDMTAEEQRAIQTKGGKASAESRRRSKTFRDVITRLLEFDVSEGVLADLHKTIETDYPSITADEAIILAQIARAIKGDTAAAQFVRDTIGERPADMISATLTGGVDVTIKVVDTAEGKGAGDD